MFIRRERDPGALTSPHTKKRSQVHSKTVATGRRGQDVAENGNSQPLNQHVLPAELCEIHVCCLHAQSGAFCFRSWS